MTAVEADVRALRTAVAIVPGPAAAFVELEGAAAFEIVDALTTRDLFLQDGQLCESLILDESGDVELDVLVGRDDDRMIVVADGADPSRLAALLRGAASMEDIAVRRLDETHEALSLHGPYAWELLGAWLGDDLVGMPHLSHERAGDVRVLRAGKTGEYGYEVLLPRERAEALRDQLTRLGARFDARAVGAEAITLARLENGLFDGPALAGRARDPLELQLGWRISRSKAFRGSDAVARRRAAGATRRVTWLRSAERIAIGDVVTCGGEPIGEVIHAAACPVTRSTLGLGLLHRGVACAGLEGLDALRADGSARSVATVSPPQIVNRSLFVSPQRHTYEGRATRVLPEPWP